MTTEVFNPEYEVVLDFRKKRSFHIGPKNVLLKEVTDHHSCLVATIMRFQGLFPKLGSDKNNYST